jgi:NADPH:quinone reductase-like Zn-dependent oxidoreductase
VKTKTQSAQPPCQMAKHVGAHVTAVYNTKNVELVRSLGPGVAIDYEQQDFTKNGNVVLSLNGGPR